jgi:putative ABC transport system permease protein
MIVTQRSREIALLRAVGSTRGQVMRNLIMEAFLLGAGASAIGLGLGIVVAKGLTALMSVLGFQLPTTSSQIEVRTIIVSLLVGTLVTVVAAIAPARRATRVLPVEALRDATPSAQRSMRRRAIVGSVITGAGIIALAMGLFGGAGIAIVGLGVLATLLGATALLPLAVRPVATAIGWPLRARGVPGDLARQNALRNPRRTGATAAALMIGLTLVVSVGVLATSLKKSVSHALGDSTSADLFIARASVGTPGFSSEVGKAVAAVSGVDAVSMLGFGEARFAGSTTTYSSVDPATVDRLVDLQVSTGRTSNLGDSAVMVRKDVAESHGWKVGDQVRAEFAATGKHELSIAAIFDRKDGFIDSDYLLSLSGAVALDGARLAGAGLVLVADGADQAAVQARIKVALADHPDAQVLTLAEYEKETGGFIDQLLIFVTVMLLLAVVIALIGIVNTLALSVFERTRELGLLRAVGMTRNQVRAMVRWESVVISLLGALGGAVLGIGLGISLVRALKDEGIGSVGVDPAQISIYVACAALAGVVAALGPARSAAKVDVLKAVVTD